MDPRLGIQTCQLQSSCLHLMGQQRLARTTLPRVWHSPSHLIPPLRISQSWSSLTIPPREMNLSLTLFPILPQTPSSKFPQQQLLLSGWWLCWENHDFRGLCRNVEECWGEGGATVCYQQWWYGLVEWAEDSGLEVTATLSAQHSLSPKSPLGESQGTRLHIWMWRVYY